MFNSGSKNFFEVLDNNTLDLKDIFSFSAIVKLNSINDIMD